MGRTYKRDRNIVKSSVQIKEEDGLTKVISDSGKEYEMGYVVDDAGRAFDLCVIIDWDGPQGPDIANWFAGEDFADDEEVVGGYIEEYENKIVKSSRKPIKSGTQLGVDSWDPNDKRTAEDVYKDEIIFELDANPGIRNKIGDDIATQIANIAKDPNSEIGRCVAALARACDEEYYRLTGM